MDPDLELAIAIAKAKKAKAAPKPAERDPETAMGRGLTALSDLTQGKEPQQTTGEWLYGNIIGDPNDGVQNAGETLGTWLNDMGKAAGAGAARGAAAIPGLPGTAGELFDAGVLKAGQAVGLFPEEWTAPKNALSAGSLIGYMSDATGGATDFKGETVPGRFAGTVAEFLPGAAAFGGASAGNLLRFGAVPGVASEAAGMATEGTKAEPWARAAAALLAPVALGAVGKLGAKIVSPHGGADPERLKLAQVLDDAGVPLTAGQRVGSEGLRRKEALAPSAQNFSEAQREAFTKAVLKTAGTDASRATPEVMAETAKRIGAVFDDVTQGIDIVPNNQTVAALTAAGDTYKALAPTTNQAPIIGQVVDAMTDAAAKGTSIPAATLKVWRSNLSKLTASADDATRAAASEALEAVDDAMEAALVAAGRGADVARLAEARGQWRNFLAIQRAATSAGESAAAGLLSPSAVRNAVVTQGRSAYAQGTRGDIADLARAGEGVMKQLPTSGTAENLRALMVGTPIASGFGALVGGATPVGAAAGAVLGAMAPTAMNALRMTRPAQAYLANQLLGAGPQILPSNALGLIPATTNALPR